MSDLDGLGYRGASAVVVGCSTGIGAGMVKILGELGAEVHAVSRNEPSLPHASFTQIDLRDRASIAAAAEAIHARGPIDHVLVSAGVPRMRSRDELIQVNYLGVRELVDLLVPGIVRGGTIGLIGSSTALGWERNIPLLMELVTIDDPAEAAAWCDAHPDQVGDGMTTYIFSKQAMMTWTTHAATTLAQQHGIRMNCTAPGPTATPMADEMTEQNGPAAFDAYPYPVLGRMPTGEEQAWPLILLNSRPNQVSNGLVNFTDEGVSPAVLTGTIDLMGLMAKALGRDLS